MPHKFAESDLVRPRFGGPAMTVRHVPDGDLLMGSSEYHRLWFKGASRESDPFRDLELQIFTKPSG